MILSATAAEPHWSDWPLRIEFAPFVQTLFAHLLHQQTQNLNIVAGQAMTWFPQDKQPRNYNLQTPGGEQLRLGLPEVKNRRQILALPTMTRGGVYRLLPRAATQEVAVADVGMPIAVVPDLRESQSFDTLTDEQIDSRLGFAPVHMNSSGDAAGASGFDRFQREWTLWVLLLVLLLVVGESWLAWICGRAW